MATEHRAPRAVVFDFGGTLMREGPVNLRAGAEAVLRLPRDTGGCTPDQLAGAVSELLADLDPRRRGSRLEPPPDTFQRLIGMACATCPHAAASRPPMS